MAQFTPPKGQYGTFVPADKSPSEVEYHQCMIFHFTNALVRAPGRSVVNGLSTQSGPRPSFEAVSAEHAQYVETLKKAGLTVEVLPPLEDYPDSIFVEDPALVFPGVALLLLPGALPRHVEVKWCAGALWPW